MFDFQIIMEEIKEKGLYRSMKAAKTAQNHKIVLDNKEVILFASNSYLGLCDDERIKKAAVEALYKFGTGSGGSRLTSGCYEIHMELERKLAEFKGYEDCLLFNTGYAANLGTISAIADKEWVIFCDRLNHASIIDGIRLSGAKLVVYKHCDMNDLEKKIKRYHTGKGIIVTDGVFSMDGDIAPLGEIIKIAEKYDLVSMVDDAHAIGVLGNNGKGTDEYYGITQGADIVVGTLSKSLAGEGGFVLASKAIIEYLRHKARSFVYSTAMPPFNAAVSIAALEILKQEPERVIMLKEKTKYIRKKLKEKGIETLDGEVPIIPVIIGDSEKSLELSKKLFVDGVFVPAIRPPTVPQGSSRLRISIIATHEYEELDYLANRLVSLM